MRDLLWISCQEVQRYLEILFRDVVLRSFIDVLPTDLAMDLVQVLLIGARQACGPRDYVPNFDLTHKPPLTHCLGSLAGIMIFLGSFLMCIHWATHLNGF